MADVTLDLKGLKCPQPTLRMTMQMMKMKPGQTLEVMADCESFASDLESWSKRTNKTVLWVRDEGNYKRCQVKI